MHREHAAFLETGSQPATVRTVVANSWLRSAAAGIDPDAHLPPLVLEHDDLLEYRSTHPLSRVFPLLYDVLGKAAEDCDCVMAVGDAEGKLLWVCGTPSVLRKAEAMNFVEGAAWDELHAGTNAPGTALHLDAAVQIHTAEHFNRLVQPWSCAAAPIHDPQTHKILGLVDITGGEDVTSPQTLAMVRAAARMAESELGRLAAESSTAHRSPPGTLWLPAEAAKRPVLRLHGLGRPECVAELSALSAGSRRLSPRHSEILVVLVDHPHGLTAEELEVEVYAADVHGSTMRAEMTRLRSLLGPEVLQSRPYRLVAETDCDWQAVAAQLAAGRVRDALAGYHGPLLPQSEAPGIVARRDSLQEQLRQAVLASAQPELMVAWTRSRWGADDLPMWHGQAAALPDSSPLRQLAVAEIARLERELANPTPLR
ncbi:GAF domain-containing protein [Jatrophihabitans sp. DSM 45814]